jgi:hypothetical protein
MSNYYVYRRIHTCVLDMFDGSYELRLLISCATKPWENTSTVKQKTAIPDPDSDASVHRIGQRALTCRALVCDCGADKHRDWHRIAIQSCYDLSRGSTATKDWDPTAASAGGSGRISVPRCKQCFRLWIVHAAET